MGEPLFPRANRVRQLEHALSVLDLFRPPDRGELSLSAIADELALSEEYANKLLRHLEAAGVVVRGPVSGGWRLGIRLAQLGGYAIATLRPWDEFRPPLAALQEATGLGGLIAVLSGGLAVHVDEFRGPERPLGRAFPAHATSLGKAILAELAPDERDAALGEIVLTPWTTRTIIEKERLIEDLASAKERGYALEDAEFHEARRSIGAVVRDHTGAVVAAVGVGNTPSRLPDDAIAEVAAAVVEAAGEISRRLGAGTLPELPPWRPVVEVKFVMEPPLEVRPAGAVEAPPAKPPRRQPRPKGSRAP
ncbi:MAG: IclR family transcriptional regulator [Solirubrobacterales bacterium]